MSITVRYALLSLAVGFIGAQFLVLLYNEWFWAGWPWLKIGLLAPLVAGGFAWLQQTRWGRLWHGIGLYWSAVFAIAAISCRSLDLQQLSFTNALNYEAAFVWVPAAALWIRSLLDARQRRRDALSDADIEQRRLLQLRRYLRETTGRSAAPPVEALPVALLLGLALLGTPQHAAAAENTLPVTGGAQTADDAPTRPYVDRHLEMIDKQLRIIPPEPELPGMYPTPMHLREKQVTWIAVDNWTDGGIMYHDADGTVHDAGRVLAPVMQVNAAGFTASGWGRPGCVTATAVNAIHLKTTQDYESGKGTIFSLVPIEFATFDPGAYKSYFNNSSTLFTNIKAGTGIFGGQWAPLIGNQLYVDMQDRGAAPRTSKPLPEGMPEGLRWGPEVGTRNIPAPPLPKQFEGFVPVGDTYVPQEGDRLLIRVERLKYNPEWIEFENRFGGIIWVKELELEPYPIGQVLKPVAGVGRFTGTQYADTGRIRANHPGVIDISTTPYDVIGGFQIIPRDHSMSPEMNNARVKTQWMVVGPLWALDPSWEGLPPLFSDYIYPAWTPSFNADGTPTTEVMGADVYLSRFNVKARYSDEADPGAWVPMRPKEGLDNEAFVTLTGIRLYFPRDSKL
jgi:hypothetical protein